MAYLLQLYHQENSLKCRVRNKLLREDIHITITEGRGCVAEGKVEKQPTPMENRSFVNSDNFDATDLSKLKF